MIHCCCSDLRAPTLHLCGEYHVLGKRSRAFLSTKYRGVAQLVARTAGGREVAGSNPVVPTNKE